MPELIQFLLHPNFTGWLLIIKIIFLFFSAFFLGFIIWALTNTSWFKKAFLQDLIEFSTYKPYRIRKFKKEWEKLRKRLETGLESELKLAVIEADTLLNETLKRTGYPGESLGERLDKVTTDILPNLEEVRKAHELRNNIIHDPTYRLGLEETKKTLAIYEKTLIELQTL